MREIRDVLFFYFILFMAILLIRSYA